MTICPHCKRSFAAENLGRHARVCQSDPAVQALTRQALEDPCRPGYSRKISEYSAAAAAIGAPSKRIILNTYGNWTKACAAYGLVFVRPKQGAPRDDYAAIEVAAIEDVAAAVELYTILRRRERNYQGLEVCRSYTLRNGDVAHVLR